MPGPAARVGDNTAHGGVIVGPGAPNVLIAGQPASVMGDNHVCPMQTPAPVPIPHVGGPVVMPGAPTVLIANRPASTMGCVCVCVGPPDSIVKGAPNVILGTAGAGAGAAGAAGGAGAAGANASAAAAKFDNIEATILEEHWVVAAFVDKAGLPVSGLPYAFQDTAKKTTTGVLKLDGAVRRSGLKKEGTCEITLMNVFGAAWSKDTAKVGDTVKLKAKVDGFEGGTPAQFVLFARDLQGPDLAIATLDAKTQGDKVEAEWAFAYDETLALAAPEDAARFAYPQFYFNVIVEDIVARSGLLEITDTIELEVRDERDQPLKNAPYILTFSNGQVRRGTLNGQGKAKEEKVPLAHWSLVFPDHPDLHLDG